MAHIRLNTHPLQGGQAAPAVKWGARDPAERGPVVGTVADPGKRNAIGVHSGSYGIYRALAIAAQELEKFALYLGASPANPKELDPGTFDLLGADSAEADLMRLGDLALAGKMNELLDELGRLPHGGSEAVPILRALQRRMLMLAPLRARIERGERVGDVTTSMGKALFWKDKSSVQRMLTRWSAEELATISERAGGLERRLMFSEAPEQEALAEELLTIARRARSRA